MKTEKITITIAARASEKLSAIRAAGNLPAVYYGPKEAPTPITIDAKAFEKARKAAGESTIITLTGLNDDVEVLIKDVQWHPLSDEAIHVDFYAIERGKKLVANIALEFIGEAPAEKLGGNVNKGIHEIEIEVLPRDLPQHIDVDLTKLTDMNSVITASDLPLPESATLTNIEADFAIASMTMAVEEDLSAPVGDAMAPEEAEAPTEGEEEKKGE